MPARSPASIRDKLGAIIDEIDRTGHADLLRLTVLKRWFAHPARLYAFGLWVARQAAARGETGGVRAAEAGPLFAQARALLLETAAAGGRPDWSGAERLYRCLRAFQNEFERQAWGPVRIIRNHDLYLIEAGLALYLALRPAPGDGYRLAADYCGHYSSAYGRDLNGPARDRLLELIGFITAQEAGEPG
ncbi:MAG: hypothetical protein EA400_13170 [Chromatiaceae bacterium]|nr:MAG: hypothetical protein EA400_13170 [Chromatiaceae bacterium]